MKQVKGFWLPDGEIHLVPFLEHGPEFAGGPTYQLHKLLAAMPHIKNFRHAVDIGAHCGLWTRPMARCFARVSAFEPIEDHRACFLQNFAAPADAGVIDAAGCTVKLRPYALGEVEGNVKIATKADSSGDAKIVKGDVGFTARMRPLDSFALTNVDFIKIDCEGYELFVVKGGEATIRRDKPTIVIEQKPNKGAAYGIGDRDAMMLLLEWGGELKWEHGGDFLLRWK